MTPDDSDLGEGEDEISLSLGLTEDCRPVVVLRLGDHYVELPPEYGSRFGLSLIRVSEMAEEATRDIESKDLDPMEAIEVIRQISLRAASSSN